MAKNTYRYVDSNTIEIDLTQGMTCLIDASDYDLIKDHRWCYNKHKKGNTGYVVTHIPINDKRKTLMIHRLILNPSDKNQKIDHINRNGCDNRRSNLRVCSHQQNLMNKPKQKDNESGFKGVSYDKQTKKFRAQISFNNKDIYLGRFADPIEAAKSYDRKALELFGEFAVLNFPQILLVVN